jgi:hypothetical protein
MNILPNKENSKLGTLQQKIKEAIAEYENTSVDNIKRRGDVKFYYFNKETKENKELEI